jgi:glutamine amidotransferase
MTTVVIDHGRSNLFSLVHALSHLGERHIVTSDPSEIALASRIVLPGVGAFGDVMRGMIERGLIAPLREALARRVPTLGICVGMQMLADRSEEFGDHPGLGVIPGVVRRLPDLAPEAHGLRVPNVGWRTLIPRAGNVVFDDLPARTMVYFVHSYAFEAAHHGDVVATIDFNGRPVTAAVQAGAVFGYQFHPEKSGPDGLALLRRFLSLSPDAN